MATNLENLSINEIINFAEQEAHIKVLLYKKTQDISIDIHLKKNKNKGIAVNKTPIKKISEFVGIENVVIFSPEDLKLIKEGPINRRKYIDLYTMQIDKLYTYNLVNYNKILNQRNKLLRELYFTQNNTLLETIDIWDQELVKYGIEIIKKRRN